MFASVGLAQRIDSAEVDLTLQGGRFIARRHPETIALEIAGGAAVSTGQGSPFDKVIGLGFAPFEQASSALVAFEEAVLARGGVVQVELASLADPSVARWLGRRGYALVGFENVLGIDPRASVHRARPDASDVEVSRAAPNEIDTWIDVVASGFARPDEGDGPESHESFPRAIVERAMRDMIEVDGVSCYLARRGGTVVGGASMRFDAARRVAQLTGAATLHDQRRRGVQSALLRARLERAAETGAEVAVITTRPGSKSQENAQKSGFALLYVRAILLKPGSE